MKAKSIKVIFDTNVWISFLIGKRLAFIKKYIANGQITVIVTQQLLDEIKDVTGREKLKKYFPQEKVVELMIFLNDIAKNVKTQPTYFINRNPKDNFLLDLIHFSKADYLVTGDGDLLGHSPFRTATILTPSDFEKIMTDKNYK
jgi:putative PIN family toxin of toxin-antitoxin system